MAYRFLKMNVNVYQYIVRSEGTEDWTWTWKYSTDSIHNEYKMQMWNIWGKYVRTTLLIYTIQFIHVYTIPYNCWRAHVEKVMKWIHENKKYFELVRG